MKAFLASLTVVAASTLNIAHADGDFEAMTRVVNLCTGAGNLTVNALHARQIGLTLAEVNKQVENDNVPNTDWAHAVEKVKYQSVDYGYNKATSDQDAYSIGFAKCMDTLKPWE